MRDGRADELTALASLVSRLELRVFDAVTAEVATSLAAAHRLRAADAVHLATAVVAGADRFVTNNRRDFPDTLLDRQGVARLGTPPLSRPGCQLVGDRQGNVRDSVGQLHSAVPAEARGAQVLDEPVGAVEMEPVLDEGRPGARRAGHDVVHGRDERGHTSEGH